MTKVSTDVVPSDTSGLASVAAYCGATSLTSVISTAKVESAVDPSALVALMIMLHVVATS